MEVGKIEQLTNTPKVPPSIDPLISKMLTPNTGDKWFVQLKDSMELREVYICDLTSKTVQIRDVISHHPHKLQEPTRFKRSDVDFVERNDG